MNTRAAFYLRVSTPGQTTENQRRALEMAAARHGWEVVATFEDAGISGTLGRDKRPGFDALCRATARREFDLVATWSVCRLGRSLRELLGFLAELEAKGVGLYLDQQGLDTTTPAGRALFQMVGVFAEFEREMIRDRSIAGQQRAKAAGKRIGRPPLPPLVVEAIRQDLACGSRLSQRKLAEKHGVDEATIRRIKKTMGGMV